MVDGSKVLGSMTIHDGQIIKADGELVNAERVANLLQKMVAVGPIFPPVHPKTQVQQNQTTGPLIDLFNDHLSSQTSDNQGKNSTVFEQLTILYPDHQFDIAIGEMGGVGGPMGMVGSTKQQQKQVIHVVKRARALAD